MQDKLQDSVREENELSSVRFEKLLFFTQRIWGVIGTRDIIFMIVLQL